jgi:hypothetical protein
MPDSEEYPLTPDHHPESVCNCCGGPNISWCAPSPLWNEVMRGGDINGPWQYDEIICPTCFTILAEAAGIASMWRLHAERVTRPLQLVTPSGRAWNEQTWLWEEPATTTPTTPCRSHLTGQPWGESWCVLAAGHGGAHAESWLRWTDEQACADEGHHGVATAETPALDEDEVATCKACDQPWNKRHQCTPTASPAVDDQDDERCRWGCGRVATGPSTYIADGLCTACAVDDAQDDEAAANRG